MEARFDFLSDSFPIIFENDQEVVELARTILEKRKKNKKGLWIVVFLGVHTTKKGAFLNFKLYGGCTEGETLKTELRK